MLLGALRAQGRLTRAQLAAATGLSRSATAAGVAALLAAGLITEEPTGPTPGAGAGPGRPSGYLVPARPAGAIVGLDFGHTHLRVAVADSNAAVLETAEESLDVDGDAGSAIDAAERLITAVLNRAGVDRGQVRALAAGIPGPLDRQRRVVTSPTILRSWIDLPASDALSQRLGLPVVTENDANLGALGEMNFGAARGCRDFLYIKASHGIGAGLVLGGRIYHGSAGIAGEIGHTPLPGENNRCRCGNRGCLESVSSATQVREQLHQTYLDAMPFAEVARDPVGVRVLADAGRTIGRVVADGCNWLNPRAIILGGELGVTGEAFASGFRESLLRFGRPAVVTDIAVRSAGLGRRSEVLGALALARDTALEYSI